MSHKPPSGLDDEAKRQVRAALTENRTEQGEAQARGDEDRLAALQDQEDKLLAYLRGRAPLPEGKTKDMEDQGCDSTRKQVHAVEMSVFRAIGSLKEAAPGLAKHLKVAVKVNGVIRYEKVRGWDWKFLFPLEPVNLLVGDPRDQTSDSCASDSEE